MTKRYQITTMEYVYNTVEVEANSEKEAYDMALIDDLDWKTYKTDQWDVESIVELTDETV